MVHLVAGRGLEDLEVARVEAGAEGVRPEGAGGDGRPREDRGERCGESGSHDSAGESAGGATAIPIAW